MSTSTQIAPKQAPQQNQSLKPLLEVAPVEFAEKFSRTPFLIRHRLTDHPLFAIDRLLELAKSLPEGCLEYNAGQLPVNCDPSLTPLNGLSAEETIERIATCKSWMAIKYVENDPEYRDLLHRCLGEIAPHSEPIVPGMTQAQGFIFVTSPGSVTPYHIDPEHNFLLQIRGAKHIHLYDGNDRTLLDEVHLERFYSDEHRNLKLHDARIDDGWKFDLQPGMGLHFPVTYPHWVQNQDEVSVSFSITFRTPDLDRRRALYQINHQLRKRGWTPPPVGDHRLRDTLAYTLFRIRRKLLGTAKSDCSRSCNGM
ncbi:MAG: cupin-like domain-containing protein [Planctomycetaceae bacterium]|nr:cupin-like domain-containing protein [Planctomycetaceae bacterium]